MRGRPEVCTVIKSVHGGIRRGSEAAWGASAKRRAARASPSSAQAHPESSGSPRAVMGYIWPLGHAWSHRRFDRGSPHNPLLSSSPLPAYDFVERIYDYPFLDCDHSHNASNDHTPDPCASPQLPTDRFDVAVATNDPGNDALAIGSHAAQGDGHRFSSEPTDDRLAAPIPPTHLGMQNTGGSLGERWSAAVSVQVSGAVQRPLPWRGLMPAAASCRCTLHLLALGVAAFGALAQDDESLACSADAAGSCSNDFKLEAVQRQQSPLSVVKAVASKAIFPLPTVFRCPHVDQTHLNVAMCVRANLVSTWGWVWPSWAHFG